MHLTFETAGVYGGLRRLLLLLRSEFSSLVARQPVALCDWVYFESFENAVTRVQANPVLLLKLVDSMHAMTDWLKAFANQDEDMQAKALQRKPVEAPECLHQSNAQLRVNVALLRQTAGHLLETVAAVLAKRICSIESLPTGSSEMAKFTKLCNDSYMAAVWTSAHTEFLSIISELHFDNSVNLEIPDPELHFVTCASNCIDLIALYERFTCQKTCSKTAEAMLSLLIRATNAGSRGWETALHGAIKDSEGTNRICAHALKMAYTGMHPCLHPAARYPFDMRMVVSKTIPVTHSSQKSIVEFASITPTVVKECIRLYLGLMLSEDMATMAAFNACNQPAGQLKVPPHGLPPAALASILQSMCDLGCDAAYKQIATCKQLAEFTREQLNISTDLKSRKRKAPNEGNDNSVEDDAKPIAKPAASAKSPVAQFQPLVYLPSWLGGRIGNSPLAFPSATSILSGLLSSNFRAMYVPFWCHANSHNQRASRLDTPQFQALHNESPAHKMMELTNIKLVLKVLRFAMRVPDSSLLSIADVASALGLDVPLLHSVNSSGQGTSVGRQKRLKQQVLGTSAQGSETPSQHDLDILYSSTSMSANRAVQDAEMQVLLSSAHTASVLLAFSRCAALKEQTLTYDLGKATLRMQSKAICRRMRVDPTDMTDEELQKAVDALPLHATHIYACSECKRITNALQNGSGKNVAFNEIGLAASMLRLGICPRFGQMRCAKRSSAALRTALCLEAGANQHAVEGLQVNEEAPLPKDLRPASIVAVISNNGGVPDTASDVAKLRRDIKNSYEQYSHAVACGDIPLVTIKVLGRATRLFGNWYSLCCYCGCLCEISPNHRFGQDVCCTRCDFAMLYSKELEKKLQQSAPRSARPKCRFCGKPEPENTNTKYRMLAAPMDNYGKNASVPPPLRQVHYCASHYRSWLVEAHKQMTTPVILGHICTKAHPVFGASTGKRDVSEAERDMSFEASKKSDRQHRQSGHKKISKKRSRRNKGAT
jgi:hypothetical protein